MPQMAPSLWLPIFCSTMSIILLFSMMTYFFCPMTVKALNINFKKTQKIWKW